MLLVVSSRVAFFSIALRVFSVVLFVVVPSDLLAADGLQEHDVQQNVLDRHLLASETVRGTSDNVELNNADVDPTCSDKDRLILVRGLPEPNGPPVCAAPTGPCGRSGGCARLGSSPRFAHAHPMPRTAHAAWGGGGGGGGFVVL